MVKLWLCKFCFIHLVDNFGLNSTIVNPATATKGQSTKVGLVGLVD